MPVSAERSDAACIKTGTRNIVILLFLQSDFIKQSVLLCRVNRQISVKFICLVEAKKDVSLSAEARSAAALVEDKLTSNCQIFDFFRYV